MGITIWQPGPFIALKIHDKMSVTLWQPGTIIALQVDELTGNLTRFH